MTEPHPNISVFRQESCLADTEKLLSIVDYYPWSLYGDSTPLSKEELSTFLSSDYVAIPPYVYVDDDKDCRFKHPRSNYNAQRSIHLSRIAWLINNFDHAMKTKILGMFDSSFRIFDGHHSLYAAAYTGLPTINIVFDHGDVNKIEKLDFFIEWNDKPANNNKFGKHILSDDSVNYQIFHRNYSSDNLFISVTHNYSLIAIASIRENGYMKIKELSSITSTEHKNPTFEKFIHQLIANFSSIFSALNKDLFK